MTSSGAPAGLLAEPTTKPTKSQTILKLRGEALAKGFKSPDELQEWLWVVLGVWLPNRSVCPGHCSPLEYVTDTYFERVLDTILWAARIWGKSFDAALLCWLKSRYRSMWEANICSGSAAQAGRVYKAADLFWRATDEIGGRAVLRKEPLKTYTEFLNGSMYEITTASTKSQRGPHPNALFADEIDEMDVDVFGSAMQQTADQRGHQATTALMSTMHKVGGLMGNWVDNAEIRGYKLYVSCILEAMESCLDENCERCNLDEYCQRRYKVICKEERARQLDLGIIVSREHPRMGHNSVENVQRKVRQGYEEDETTGGIQVIDVPAELFCQRPSRTGLVFKEFNDNWHVVPAQEIRVEKGMRLGRTTDFGFTAPFVDLHFAITPRDQIIFYSEFVQSGMTMPQITARLKMGLADFLRTFADPGGATEIDTLKKAGIPVTGIGGELTDRLDLIRVLLRTEIDGRPGIIISSNCPIFIAEMRKYSYPEKGDSEKPVDKDNHCIEAAGRGIKGWKEGWLTPLKSLIKDVQMGGGRDNAGTTRTGEAYQEAKEESRQRIQRGRRSSTRGARVADYVD